MFNRQPTLTGPTTTVRPIQPSDWPALFRAAQDPDIWRQHPNPLLCTEPEFQKYFDRALQSQSAFVMVENATQAIMGTSSYYDIDPIAQHVAIGYTFLAKRYWGQGFNREIKHLMIDHALGTFQQVWFHVATSNLISRKAVTKLGAALSHEGTKTMNQQEVPYCFYVIRKEGWGA